MSPPLSTMTYRHAAVRLLRAPVRPHVSLLFTCGGELRAVALREGEPVVVGRSEPSHCVIDDRSLSGTHARFTLAVGGVVVEDLQSTNGTCVRGAQVKRVTLRESDIVRLGDVEVALSGLGVRIANDSDSSDADFSARLTDELERARFFGRSVTLLALRYASGAVATDDTEARIRTCMRPVDHLHAYGAAGARLMLLPEADLAYTRDLALRLHSAVPGALALGAATFATNARSAEAWIAVAMEGAQRAHPGSGIRAADPAPSESIASVVVKSERMQRLYALVARVARTTMPVLILGETGSGKEVVAHAVHDKSPRHKGPFRAINCAVLPANLLEATLFGHEKGAFTGADRQSPGLFEQAQGGTVFLDEVGELSPQAQAALLRVLETKRIVRIGGSKEIEVDARVVAATHRDLAEMTATGEFREDLLYRLDALTLSVPPLRERVDEIDGLSDLFLSRAREQWDASASAISAATRQALKAYAWPGNVRQLRNVIERAAAICMTNTIELDDLPAHLFEERTAQVTSTERESKRANIAGALPDRIRHYEIDMIRDALAKAGGNQTKAAAMLGLPRRTLANKVHAYGLVVE